MILRPDVKYTRSAHEEPPTIAAVRAEAQKRGLSVRANDDGTYTLFRRCIITGKVDAERVFSTRLSCYKFCITGQLL